MTKLHATHVQGYCALPQSPASKWENSLSAPLLLHQATHQGWVSDNDHSSLLG